MARKKQDTVGQKSKCTECNRVVQYYVCKRRPLSNGKYSDPVVFCVPCNETTHKQWTIEHKQRLERAEHAVRNHDWEF